MSFTRWLRSLRSAIALGRHERPHRWQPAPRLCLEALEDRTLLSTFTVTNLLDAGPGSLRAAVAAANANPGADVINFATTGAIALTTGELDITDGLTINGPGVNNLTVSGNHISRVFGPAGNPTVVIADLTVADGWSPDVGGGIYEPGGTLTLDHCALSGNVATEGGGLYSGGGAVYVNQTTISNNQAVGSAGISGVDFGYTSGYPGGNGLGGGFYIGGGAVSIDNSTFTGNGARGGRGGDGVPGYYTADYPYPPFYLSIPDGIGGDGGSGLGGAINVVAGAVQVNHSTLSGNWATGGLGGFGYPGGSNGVGAAGGISNAGSLQMYDTILAGNSANVAPDLNGAVTSPGHNLIGNSLGGSGYAASDLLNVDPRLGPLQNNGGPTKTMALLAGSPAINAGDNTGAPASDQRGPGFARIVNGIIDIGAFEVQTPSAPQASSFIVSGFPASTMAGAAGGFTVTAKNMDGTTAVNYAGTVHFSSSDGQAGLPVDYAFIAADAGVHNFSATLKTAGAQSLTATDAITASLTGSEKGVMVNPAAAGTLTVTGFPSSITAGVAATFTVTLKDAYGNIASGYTGQVHFTSSDGKASLPANYTFTAADAGVHTFTNGVALKTAGSQTVTATDAVTASVAGNAVVMVNPAAASTLTVAGFPSSITAGVAATFTVTLKDAYGNIASGYTGKVHFSSSDNKASMPADYTFTAADAGAHTFRATLKTVGTQSITVRDVVAVGLRGLEGGINVKKAAGQTCCAGASATVHSGDDSRNNSIIDSIFIGNADHGGAYSFLFGGNRDASFWSMIDSIIKHNRAVGGHDRNGGVHHSP